MRNKLQLMGLLGLVGLLGTFTDNPGFYGFFGFFGFFAFRNVVPDERFKENVSKAGRNAFFVSIVLFTLAMVFISLILNPELYAIAFTFTFSFALSFALQILVFSISLQIYEGRSN
ncbi:MAG: DUF3796 domain-containing protein [Firmicutes bacterium]|nr:DUF3796 domain-containing protein [Bacillota bacterium]